MDLEQVPGIALIRAKLDKISPSIVIDRVTYDPRKMMYYLILKVGDREGEVQFSEDFLDDLRDNPDTPTTKYSRNLEEKLTNELLAEVEKRGLISYSESTLKFLLLKYIHEATKETPHVHKYNTIGRADKGGFERWLQVSLTEIERQTLIWAWDELRRLRLIVPTGRDLVNPDDWIELTDKGLAAIEGKEYVEFSEGEHFINKGEVYTAYHKIKGIMKQAQQELLVIDSHVNDEVVDMLATLNPVVNIRLITNYLHGDFGNAYQRLKKQRGYVEARKSNHFHDRFIIIDGAACYQLGASIQDAGSKATVIDRKEDATRARILAEAEEIWASSKEV